MFIPAIVDFFKYKIVGSAFVLACWPPIDKVNFVKQFSRHGMSVTYACDPKILENVSDFNFQGVLYIEKDNTNLLEKVNRKHFSHWYKWLIISDKIPDALHRVRYDSDMAILRNESGRVISDNKTLLVDYNEQPGTSPRIFFDDIYVHPRDGATQHEWAHWSDPGLQVTRDWQKILRRRDVQKYRFRIATPLAHYSENSYKGSFTEYLVDMTVADAGLRCGFAASSLVVEAINATQVLVPVIYWVAEDINGTLATLRSEAAEVGAGGLRMMKRRMEFIDFVMPIWLFNTGFTYLAERESSSNMYVEPFTATVWWSCLAIGITLAIAQRVASRKPEEKEGAYMTVLATCLQQDANAVPDGLTGRWTFTVLSICSMLVHAYYTSAIVSALMSTGRGGPKTLKELADSRYAISSEDHDFVRNTMFNAAVGFWERCRRLEELCLLFGHTPAFHQDMLRRFFCLYAQEAVETNWEELEYLKKKKMTSTFYQDIRYGVQLVQQGYTAYHSEYHQIYHYLDIFSDNDICKIQHVDTIPATMTWMSTTIRGQWTNILKIAGAWLYETGLARRVLSHMQLRPPPCRVALLAERVTFWDVAPLLALTTLGAIASLGLLGLEIIFAKWGKRSREKVERNNSEVSLIYIE